jgi:4-amino-4-deoxy-L-arabinose transferase-like glycosyltransferase
MAKTFRQKIKKLPVWLILILLLASFLRLWQLDLVPPSLFGDELDVGYHAYSLLKTGKDYSGQFLPTYIRSLAEWRAPLFIYSVAPFIKILGLNELGVRASAVFFGVLGIFFLYLLVKEIFNDQRLALLAALLLAVCPWHLHYSRAAFEVTLLLSLFLGGILLLFKGLKKPAFLLPAAVLLALTPYTYSTANLFLPLLLFSFLLIFRKQIFKLDKKWILVSLLTALIILTPFIYDLISGQAGDRFTKISIFSDESLINEINFRRNQGGGGGRLYHNKLTAFSRAFVSNYLTAFSPQFLFLTGDPNPRQGLGDRGELYLIFLPLLLAGIWVGLENFKSQPYQLMFAWLIISPIPASLTQGGGSHATRLFIMLPTLILFSSLGVLHLLKGKKKWLKSLFLSIIFCFLLIEMIFYLHQYYVHYPKDSWRWWQYGYEKTMVYIKENQLDYEKVLINSTYEPALVRFLFWTKYDPARFHQEFTGDEAQENILPGFDGFKVDKFYFGSLNKEGSLGEILSPRTLYLISQEEEVPGDWDWRKEPPSGVKVLNAVTNPMGEPLFYLVTGE